MATTQCKTETPQSEVKFKCSTEESIKRMLELRAHYDALNWQINLWEDLRRKGIKVSDYKIRKKKQEMKKEFPDGKPKF